MTTDHYAEAVSSIDNGNNTSLADPACAYYIQRAQVHATLALVDAIRITGATTIEIDGKKIARAVSRGNVAARRDGAA